MSQLYFLILKPSEQQQNRNNCNIPHLINFTSDKVTVANFLKEGNYLAYKFPQWEEIKDFEVILKDGH